MWQSHVQRYCAAYIGMTGWFMHIGIYLHRCVGIEAHSIESNPKSRESIPFAQKPINKGILPTLKRKPAAVMNVSRSAFLPIK